MKEIRYFYVPDAPSLKELPEDEALHALRVLRLKGGDEIYLMDGCGYFYKAVVTLTNNKHCMYEIQEAMPQVKTWNGNIHIAVAPTKMMERVEWFCEKSTEIGIDDITFLDTKFTERKVLRAPRLEKIVVSAVKQSRKPWVPNVTSLVPFKDFIREPREGRKFIAHCYEEISRSDLFSELYSLSQKEEYDDVTILIGPEGDFSIDEVMFALDNGFESVSLGTSRLRTETAALYATMMAHVALRK